MITLKQLRYFESLAAAGHFGRAADLAGISQPALSMQIRDLEATLGGSLIERSAARGAPDRARCGGGGARDPDSRRRPRPRGAGRRAGDPVGQRSELGIIPSVAPYLLPRLMALVEERYPEARLSIRETVTRTLVGELAAGGLDAIVGSVPFGVDEFAEAEAFDDAFLLAAPNGSPHAERTPALAEMIGADELLLLEDGHCLRDQALAVCS